jgi:hypothetical protein
MKLIQEKTEDFYRRKFNQRLRYALEEFLGMDRKEYYSFWRRSPTLTDYISLCSIMDVPLDDGVLLFTDYYGG